MGSRARAALLAAGVTVLATLAPAAASPSGTPPAAPTGIHVQKVSSSSFTVTLHKAAHAKTYRLYVATKTSRLGSHYLGGDRSVTSKHPTLTIKRLGYQLAPYYFRVETFNGPRHTLSNSLGTVFLRPKAPRRLHSVATSSKAYLTWQAGKVSGFTIEQATNHAMTAHRRLYKIRGTTGQFTPYGLAKGATYYYRVRAVNGSTDSAYSRVVSAQARTLEQPVRVMTYNVLEAIGDGRREGGNVVAPWSQRKAVVAKLIKQGDPDVAGIQEAGSWLDHPGGTEQIYSLMAALGGEYTLAHTEIPPGQLHFTRIGVDIIYKSSVYKAVGKGGHWNIGQTRWAAWQELQNRATGAKFLFVSTHLLDPSSLANDRRREAETKTMVKNGRALAARRHVPIVYVGDFNSDQAHPLNGPPIAMRSLDIADSWNAAQHRTQALYNSAEGYYRRPPKKNSRIDYVWAPPGVAVASWGLVMDLRHGKFVGTIGSDHNPVVVNLRFPYS
ncbi:MAG TPA: endonuclease/exonuclease/phosphatase family protein [Mycobacteriales bacterium]|nr:endonuclease/exonuclease/phosphatase family protein [Mycobacteriales bacterium]